MRTILLVFVLAQLPCWSVAQASDLDEFESDASQPKKREVIRHRGSSASAGDGDTCFSCDLVEGLLHIAVDLTKAGVMYGMASSEARQSGYQADELGLELRQPGEPLLPSQRFDLAYQNINSDISAVDGRVEVGKGAFGAQARLTSFQEQQPKDSMQLFQLHGLLRLSYGNNFAINPGLGLLSLSGNNHRSALSLALPVYWHFHPNVGLEMINAYSFGDVSLDDKDYGVLFSRGNWSAKLGYRRFITPSSHMSGYYFGLSFRR